MGKGKSALLGIIALIIGISGLGLGVFTFLNPQVIEGPKGIEYPVSSEEEINDALDAIGTGYGIITITNNITLNGTIDINGGGNYIIQGSGAFIICKSDQRAIYITNATSLTIQNIKIDTTEVTTSSLSIIQIDEVNDNHIYIKNMHIIGDDNTMGRGFYVLSDNVWVSECYFHKLNYAIWQNGGNKAHIYDNVIDDVDTGGIRLAGTNNFIKGNLISNTGLYGVWTESISHYNCISNNIIYYFDQWGVRVSSDYNLIVGNHMQYDNDITESAGIYVDGDYNTIDANGCFNIAVPTILYGFGIRVAAGFNNSVVGNTCLFNEWAFYDAGSTNTYVSGNQFY
ncbi:MAG: NosD domain-containing protein [Promethearchaeota archaeon]|jgi:hypothetical protein